MVELLCTKNTIPLRQIRYSSGIVCSVLCVYWHTLILVFQVFQEIIALYFENSTNPINVLCVQSAELMNTKAGDTFTYHSGLRRHHVRGTRFLVRFSQQGYLIKQLITTFEPFFYVSINRKFYTARPILKVKMIMSQFYPLSIITTCFHKINVYFTLSYPWYSA